MKYKINEETGKYKCPECDKEYSIKGIGNHIWRAHGEGKSFSPNEGYKDGTRKGTNKFIKAEQLGKDKPIVSEEAKENMSKAHIGNKLSKKTKDKISKARIKYLNENPDKVPYILNHYSKGESYPEQYFREIFEIRNINFQQEVRERLYSLDFVVGNINTEIDGEQHYVDGRIKESDIKRNKYLESIGYEIRRVRWAEYQKLKKEEKEIYINELLSLN